MIRSVSLASVFATLIIFIQTTWLKNGVLFSATPDVALILILWMSFHNKNIEGLFAAFVIGLVQDFLSSAPLGFHIFLYVVPAYIAVIVRASIFIDRIFMPLAVALVATVLKALLSMFLSRLFGSDVVIAYSFRNIRFWIECLMNILLASPIFWVLSKTGKALITKSHTE